VRVKLYEGGTEALVTYRNRVQEIHVPDLAALPDWHVADAEVAVPDGAGVA
jgi:hypothetical protein